MNDALREFAQNPDRYTWISSDVDRFADERVCVIQGTTWAGVSGVRVGDDDVETLVAEVRERVPAEKGLVWWLDPDTQPADLHERLLALGLREPRDGGSRLHALACVEEPPPGPRNVDVRRVETYEEHLAATEVIWESFTMPPDRRAKQLQHLRAEFEAARDTGVPVTFLAHVDGRPAGVGRSIYSDRGVFLIAGSVLEWARGRGVYRTLVRARWDDAVARGTPALVTEALHDTSYPILKRCGFVDVCIIRRLEDPR
ncbi:MAG: GNAT family N-acetyltransferase [Gaiellaceae bacterium]